MLGIGIVVQRRGWCGGPEGSYVTLIDGQKQVIIVTLSYTVPCLLFFLDAGFQVWTPPQSRGQPLIDESERGPA